MALLRRYLLTLALVAGAFLVRLAAEPMLAERAPFLFFTLAVFVAGGLYGVGPAVVATSLSVLLGTYFFVAPPLQFLPLTYDELTNVGAFVVISAAMAVFAHQLARRRLSEAASIKARASSETREKRLIDAARDFAIYELDREGRILTWNKSAERLKGWKAEEIIGQPYHVLHTRESRAKDFPGRELAIAAETGGFEEEAPRMRKDGSIFAAHVSLFPLRDEQGEVTGFVKITRDISEQSEAGKAIMESRRRLEGIVESAMDAIITIDQEQRVVLFNPAAERMFECSADEALGRSINHFIPERFRPGHDEHIRRFRETGVTNRRMGALGAISGLRKSGEEFPIEASISQVSIGGERLSTVILRDITERKTSEEARNLLAREVDHRAKNALAVAQALVSLTTANTIEQFAEAIRGRIAALGRAHSLLSQSQWRGALIEDMIRDELQPYARDGQLEFYGRPLTVSANGVQSLGLLFHELATNAVKHGSLSVKEGRVCVEWGFEEDQLVLRWVERGGPPAAEPNRNGFGTRLLRQVTVRQLGAELEHDWDSKGLSVTVRLPSDLFLAGEPLGTLELDEPEGGKRPAANLQADGRGRILLVEDEELVALEMTAELSRLGWAVVGPAASLAEAQELLASQFDAAVLDVNLHGRPVYPLAEMLARRRVPFLFCTGYEMVDPEGRFPEAPVIRKPANPKAVSAALAELLNKRRAGLPSPN